MPDAIQAPLAQAQPPVKFGDDAKASLLAAASAAAGEPDAPIASAKPAAPAPPAPPAPSVAAAQPAPAAPAAAPADKAKEPKAIVEVRSALERSQARLKELEESGTATSRQLANATARVAEVANKLAAKEEEIEKTYKPIALKLTEREKQVQAMEEQLRIRDYTATTEYFDKYEKPVSTASSDVDRLLKKTEVSDANGQPRMASPADFNAVLSAKTLNEKFVRAKAIFGPDVAQTIVSEAVRMENLLEQRDGGRKTAALESAEYLKRQQTNQAQFREALRNKMLTESEVRLKEFAPAETDQELTQAYREALTFADESIGGNPAWTPDQLASTLGKARAEITAAGVLRKQVARLTTERDALTTKLQAYESSTPDIQPRNGGPLPKPENTREATMQKLQEEALKFATR